MTIMYVKLFKSIYQGTLRGNSNGLLVFTNLLAHADWYGEVDIHPRAIAEETGLAVDKVREALLLLESPDDESRTPDEEGRRIIRLDEHRAWGWRIVNYVKYRAIRNEDERREQNRAAQERFRNKKSKPKSAESNQVSATSAHIDIDTNKDKDKTYIGDINKHVSLTLPDWLNHDVWNEFVKHRGKKFTENAQKLAIKKLDECRSKGHDPTAIINTSIMNGWKGLFEPKEGSHAKPKKFNCAVEAVERLRRAGEMDRPAEHEIHEHVRGEIYEHDPNA